ncbi:unnamed protein product [Chrysodeixis includens]|uniref:Uncharacterized protein n=1 Tax=Chrysodeixis includens TaxID=689277 RepID=A0A9P0BY17_CHRIL|nr:unnamed protein product [Chrysodeixis includens]
MEKDEVDKTGAVGTSDDVDSQCAVNSLILDYYKKFGRKRGLEQFFSLSTAQSDIKDTSGLFWRKMKSENDSSDSGGGRKSDSSHEVCRISIRCSVPDASTSQDDDPRTKTDSPHTESPPIIIEEVPAETSRHTDDDSINFDDNNSQRSFDAMLDLSAHKPLSPTSSITSQRKLEWDSLADVGYANESDRKNSASSLSTLERLALKQQYSINDSKQDIGIPTSHSTPLDEEGKPKSKSKGVGKKTTKFYKKDVDLVEVNVPHSSNANQAPSINVNLTKHISFNMEKDGGITIDNVKRDVSFSPERKPVQVEVVHSVVGTDKEIQTTLTKDDPLVNIDTNKLLSEIEVTKPLQASNQKIPVVISLSTLRKKLKKKKSKTPYKRKKTKKKKEENKENTPQEKSGEPLSEAESFEYMPGHMYNQNQNKDEQRPDNSTGNKSSLESSQPFTTDSSKGSKHSLTTDLEKCIDLLKVTLQQRYDDKNTKQKLIKDIVHRLITSKYRDDESTEFLASYDSRKVGPKGTKNNNTTTSTSDTNNTDNEQRKPKKSILRNEKFNPNNIASTSQSAPNLYTADSEKVNINLIKALTSMTDSDASSKEKTSSDIAFPKTSSEELYVKYLEALRREESYKRHLRDKEMFLKQKLVSSDPTSKVSVRQEPKISSRLKDLMKDLTRNNYDDGSGDASKLEGSTSNVDLERLNPERTQRSHSVFTLSSSHSECQKRPNLKKKMQPEREIGKAGTSRDHYCCCPHHYIDSKVGYTDSSVQVNIKYQCEDEGSHVKSNRPKSGEFVSLPTDCKKCKAEAKTARVVPDNVTGEIKYVCLCKCKPASSNETGEHVIYKCSKLTNRGVQLEGPSRLYNTGVQCNYKTLTKDDEFQTIQAPCKLLNTMTDSSSDQTSNRRYSKSSQTNMLIKMMCRADDDFSSVSEVINLCGTSTQLLIPASENTKNAATIREATRCLQTEISLDPKISDPKLSDIVIVSDCECAKLVSEQVRHVCQDMSEGSYKKKTFSDMCTSSTTSKLLMASDEQDSLVTDERKSSKSCKDDAIYDSNGPPMNWTPAVPVEGFPVPVKGTNMTLMVNLGAIEVLNKKPQIHQGVVTEQAGIQDGATSVTNEFIKSAQCSCSLDRNTNHTCSNHSSLKKSSIRKTSPESYKCNTYPKNEPVKEKPPFKRSNTDTGKLDVASCTQTDKKDADTNFILAFGVPKRQQIICCHCENQCQMHRCEKGDFVKSTEILNKQSNENSPESERNYVTRESDLEKRTIQNILYKRECLKNKEKIASPRDRSVSPPSKSSDKEVGETLTKTTMCTCDNSSQVERHEKKKVIYKNNQSSVKSGILKRKYSDDENITKITCETSCQVDRNYEKTVKEKYPTKDRSDSPKSDKGGILNKKWSDDEALTKICTCENSNQVDKNYEKKEIFKDYTRRSDSPKSDKGGILNKKWSDDETLTKICTCENSNQVDKNYEKKEIFKDYTRQRSESPKRDQKRLKKILCERDCLNKNEKKASPRDRSVSPPSKSSDKQLRETGTKTSLCTCDNSSQVERKVIEKERRSSKDRSSSPDVLKERSSDDEKAIKKCTCECSSQVERKKEKRSSKDRSTSPDIQKKKSTDDENTTKKCIGECSSQVDRKYEKNVIDKEKRPSKDRSNSPDIQKKKSSDDEETTKKCTCECSSQVERRNEKEFIDKENRPLKDRSCSPSCEKIGILRKRTSDGESNKKHTCDSSCQGYYESDCCSKEDKVTKDRTVSPNRNNRRRLSFSDGEPNTKITCESSCQVNNTEKGRVDEYTRPKSPEKDLSPTIKIDVAIQNNVGGEERDKLTIHKSSDNRKTVLKDNSQMTCRNVGCDSKCVDNCFTVGCQTDVPEREMFPNGRRSERSQPKKSQDDIQTETGFNKEYDTKDCEKDPILDIIQGMTRRYSKNDLVKLKKKKCFSEIISVLNYLLETEDDTDPEPKTGSTSQSTTTKSSSNKPKTPIVSDVDSPDKQTDKGIHRKSRKDTKEGTESSDLPQSTDMPTSSDSTACKVLNKIRKECEKYHLKRCKSGRKCEISSSTSVSCDKCKKVHYCSCKSHKCKRSKALEKLQKKCVAYNLIIKNSESLVSDDTVFKKPSRPLKNIIVTVPKKNKRCDGKDDLRSEQEVPSMSPRIRLSRSRSLTRTSTVNMPSVREYLEQNRPDFVANASQRQNCLKFISERRNADGYSPRLKMVVVHQPRCMTSFQPRDHRGPFCYEPCDSTCVEPCIPYGPCEPVPCNPCEPSNICANLEPQTELPNATCCHCTWSSSPT